MSCGGGAQPVRGFAHDMRGRIRRGTQPMRRRIRGEGAPRAGVGAGARRCRAMQLQGESGQPPRGAVGNDEPGPLQGGDGHLHGALAEAGDLGDIPDGQAAFRAVVVRVPGQDEQHVVLGRRDPADAARPIDRARVHGRWPADEGRDRPAVGRESLPRVAVSAVRGFMVYRSGAASLLRCAS